MTRFPLLVFVSVGSAHAFAGPRGAQWFGRSSGRRGATERRVAVDPSTTTTRTTPSWEDLESMIPSKEEEVKADRAPVLTLYRDTNGWCPFCERVWLALEIKGLPYAETLVNLQNKPQWYKDMVPTTLVPAALFYGNDENNNDDGSTTERALVWESAEILRQLDERFPGTTKLVRDDEEDYVAAQTEVRNVVSAGFAFAYAGRNATLTVEEKEERRRAFDASLDRLDAFVVERRSVNEGPCFLLGGATPTGVDCELIPTMERWRYQLPLSSGVDVLENRPHLRRWLEEGMDALPAYADRVRGDEYSWTAVTSVFLRLFGDGDDPETQKKAVTADAAADQLLDELRREGGRGVSSIHRAVAAAKLVSNREAVVADCTDADPKSQTGVQRAVGAEPDEALRIVVHRLLNDDDNAQMVDPTEFSEGTATALRTVARRLCVPRDMGAESARALRGTLLRVAEEIDNKK